MSTGRTSVGIVSVAFGSECPYPEAGRPCGRARLRPHRHRPRPARRRRARIGRSRSGIASARSPRTGCTVRPPRKCTWEEGVAFLQSAAGDPGRARPTIPARYGGVDPRHVRRGTRASGSPSTPDGRSSAASTHWRWRTSSVTSSCARRSPVSPRCTSTRTATWISRRCSPASRRSATRAVQRGVLQPARPEAAAGGSGRLERRPDAPGPPDAQRLRPRPPSRRSESLSAEGDPADLGVLILGQALVTALSSEATLLHAPERDRGRGGVDVVDPDDAEVERLGDPQRSVEVTGVDVRRQPVGGVVGRGDHLVLVVEHDDRGDRPECLLAVDGHVGGHAGEDGGCEVVAAVEVVARQAGAAGDRSSPRGRAASATWRSIFSMAAASISGPTCDAVEGSVAGTELGHPGLQLGEEGLGDRAMDEDPIGADAGLPGVQELDQRRALGRVHRIGVGENQERCVAAELERDPLQLVRRRGERSPCRPRSIR